MKQRFERPGGGWWEILIGFGRAQRARNTAFAALPESVKRAAIAKPDLGPAELMETATVGERMAYITFVRREYIVIALSAAHDWNPLEIGAEEYVDDRLPEDVGEEISEAVAKFLASTILPDGEKKT